MATPPAECYRRGSNVPSLPDNLHLDFDSKETDGTFSAPEGDFRAKLLASTPSNHVVVARGVRMASTVHGASGMAGVGKTTSLIALGHDQLVRDHFIDGILYMPLGAETNPKHIVGVLAYIMRVTGATSSANKVEEA